MSKLILDIPRILITGTGSGCGKTTVTCAVLQALKERNIDVCAFKCGPDYIDPMFHSRVIGIPSRNLDLFLCGEDGVRTLFAKNAGGRDIAVIEGAMGMYDGIGFDSDEYSANRTAAATRTPEILVVNAKGKGTSLLAELSGYLNFTDNNVKAVILNNCSEGMYPAYKKAVEKAFDVKVLGFMPKVPEAGLESRHLGLITADEIEGLERKLKILGGHAEKTVDIDGLLAASGLAEAFETELPDFEPVSGGKFTVAAAFDKAFCFYYEDNFDLLKKLGAEIEFFSPLEDEPVPEGASGLILGGGYPEEYLEELSRAEKTKASIGSAVKSGMPVWAECGGFMYLGKTIEKDGIEYPVAGVLDGKSKMTDRLVRFGYKTLTAKRDNMMCGAGQSIKCHEFHYSDSTENGEDFDAVRNSGMKSRCIIARENIFAGYPHIHLWSNPEFAEGFARACASYGGVL